MKLRVRGTYLKPWSKIVREPLSERATELIGKTLVQNFAQEARRDFALRKWSVRDPMGGPPIHKSFSYRVRGNNIEVLSSYYGLAELLDGIPPRRLTWLTQEAHGTETSNPRRPSDLSGFMRGVAKKASFSSGAAKKGPLIVPLRGDNNRVIFRAAPTNIADAWVHPGIKKFTFGDRAVRYARRQIDQIIADDVAARLASGDMTR